MGLALMLIIKIFALAINFIKDVLIGASRLLLSSTREQKISFFITVSITTVDLFLIAPITTDYYFIHLFILFLPSGYLASITRGNA
jgi:hypothetical protein